MYRLRHITLAVFTAFSAVLLSLSDVHAQAPQGINYQAVARDTAGNPLANQEYDITIEIGDATMANVEYSETHANVPTNRFGLFTLVIGRGTPTSTGTFADVDWGAGDKYLQVTVDQTSMGITELVSVPYALYAESAGNTQIIDSTLFANDTFYIYTNTGVFSTYMEPDTATPGYISAFEVLGNDTLRIIEGNDTFDIQLNDNESTNELITDMQLINDSLLIITEGTNIPDTVDLSSLSASGTDDQTLSFNGDTVFIEDGNNIYLGYTNRIDSNALEILNEIAARQADSAGFSTAIASEIAARQADSTTFATHIANDFDTDTTNERITDMQLFNDSLLIITEGSNQLDTVDLSSLNSGSTDDQTLSFSGDTVFIENGNDIYLGYTNRIDSNALEILNEIAARQADSTTFSTAIATEVTARQADSTVFATHIANDLDIDTANELITDMQLFNDSLLIITEGNNAPDTVDVSSLNASGSDDQTLSFNGDTVFIENGNDIYLGYTNRIDSNALEILNEVAARQADSTTFSTAIATEVTARQADSTVFATHIANDLDTDTANELITDMQLFNDSLLIITEGNNAPDTVDVSSLNASGSDDQTLSFNGDTVFIENGNDIYLGYTNRIDSNALEILNEVAARQADSTTFSTAIATEVTARQADSTVFATHIANDLDIDTANELITDMQLFNDSLLIITEGNNAPDTVDVSSLNASGSDDQTLSFNGDTVFIENGNNIYLGYTNRIDSNALEILNEVAARQADSTTFANAIATEVTARQADSTVFATHIANDLDIDTANELITDMQLFNDSLLIITEGNNAPDTVDVSSLNASGSDDQTLSFSGDTVFIENGNDIYLGYTNHIDSNALEILNEIAARQADSTTFANAIANEVSARQADSTVFATHIANDLDIDTANELITDMQLFNDSLLIITEGNNAPDTVDVSSLNASGSDDQTLSFNGDTVFIENGNDIYLGYTNRIDSNALEILNEVAARQADSTTFANAIATEVTARQADSTVFATHIDNDFDTDTTNELQGLSLIQSGDSIYIGITDSNTVGFDLSAYADYDSAFTLQDTLLVMVSASGNDTLDIGSAQSINNDNDSTNEFQSLALNNALDSILISDGQGVDITPLLNDTSASNEIQNLTFQNDSVLISGGTGVDLSAYANYDTAFVIQDTLLVLSAASGNDTLDIGNAAAINNDNDSTNELIDTAFYTTSGDSLLIVEAGDTLFVPTVAATAEDSTRIRLGDSRVYVDPSDSTIAIDINGVEKYRFDEKGIRVNNTAGAVYLGPFAGVADSMNYTNGAAGANTGIGYGALQSVTGNSGGGGSQNTAVGLHALGTNQNGNANTAVGAYALDSNQNGFNTAVGAFSLTNNVNGLDNVAVGNFALVSSTGSGNVAIGREALRNASDYNVAIGDGAGLNNAGSNNTFIGRESGRFNEGSGNVFIGNQSGRNDTTASGVLYIENSPSATPLIWGDFSTNILQVGGTFRTDNLAGDTLTYPTADGDSGYVMATDGAGILSFVDPSTLFSADTLDRIVANDSNYVISQDGNLLININANSSYIFREDLVDFSQTNANMLFRTSHNGQWNVAFSSNSSVFDTSTFSGYHNFLYGRDALRDMTTASSNIAMGNAALRDNEAGSNNTALQSGALIGMTSGDNNIALGPSAGSGLTSGSNNIFLNNSGASGSYSNRLYIGSMIYGDFTADSLSVGSKLNVGGFYTFPTTAPALNQVIKYNGTSLVWADDSIGTSLNDTVGIRYILEKGSDANNDSIYNLDYLTLGMDAPNGNYRQEIVVDTFDSQQGGLYIRNSRPSLSAKYGIDIETVNSTGTTGGAGIMNRFDNTNSITGTYVGLHNNMQGGGGIRIGVFNEMNTITTGGKLYGTYTVMGNGSDLGDKIGHYVDINRNGSSDSAIAYQAVMNNGDNTPIYSFLSNMSKTSTGDLYGLHISGEDKNYLSGKLSLATTNYDSTLNVSGGAVIDALNINGNYTFPTTTPGLNQVIKNVGGTLVWANDSTGGDNLGNHTATQNIVMDTNWISNDGDDEGVLIDNQGNLGINTSNLAGRVTIETDSVAQPLMVLRKAQGTSSGNTILHFQGINQFGDTNNAQITLKNSTATDKSLQFRNQYQGGSSSTDAFIFLNNNIEQIFTIEQGGNVGIGPGNTDPTNLLSVAGAMDADTAFIDSLRIAGQYSFPTTAPGLNQVIKYNGTSLVWADDSLGTTDTVGIGGVVQKSSDALGDSILNLGVLEVDSINMQNGFFNSFDAAIGYLDSAHINILSADTAFTNVTTADVFYGNDSVITNILAFDSGSANILYVNDSSFTNIALADTTSTNKLFIDGLQFPDTAGASADDVLTFNGLGYEWAAPVGVYDTNTLAEVLAKSSDANADSIYNLGPVAIGTSSASGQLFIIDDAFQTFSGSYSSATINTAGAGASTGTQSGLAVFNSGTDGTNLAIEGYATGTNVGNNNTGIYGEGSNSSAVNTGVHGEANGTSSSLNLGVYGEANNGTSSNAGVWGQSESSTTGENFGVVGVAQNSSSLNRGVYGVLQGTTQSGDAAVYGDAQGTGFNNALFGQAINTNTGAGANTNVALYVLAENADTNYAAYFEKGAVYVGDSLIIPSGAQNNYVLTSDADGIASWQMPQSISDADTLMLSADLDSLLIANGVGVDISAILTDTSIANELIDSARISGTDLEIYQAGSATPIIADLSTLGDDDDWADAGTVDVTTGRNVGVGSSLTFSGFVQNSMSVGTSINNQGNNSVGFGQTLSISGDQSSAIGFRNSSSGLRSHTYGSWLSTSGDDALTIGSGYDGSNLLTNNLDSTLMIGMFSSAPTMTFRPGNNFSQPGRIGIGTTAPTNLLSIAGTMDVDTALIDTLSINGLGFPNSGMTSGEVLTYNGTDLSWEPISMASDGDWDTTATAIYTTSGKNVGIGTAIPSSDLDIDGSQNAFTLSVTNTANSSITGDHKSVFAEVTGSNASDNYALYGEAEGSSTGNFGVYGSATGSSTGTKYGVYGTANGSGTTWAGYFNDGNVFIQNRLGIGTVPNVSLDVSGSAIVSDSLTVGFGTSSYYSGKTTITTATEGTSVGIYVQSDNGGVDTSIAIYADPFNNGSTEYSFYGNHGVLFNQDAVGIGTDNPARKLDVVGDAFIDSIFTDSIVINNAYALPTGAPTIDGQVITYQSGALLWDTVASSADNLGNHTLDSNLRTNGFYLSNDGDNEGVFVNTDGHVGIDTNAAVDDETFTIHSNTSAWGMLNTDGNVAIGTWIGTEVGQIGTRTNHRLDFITNNSGPLMTVDTNGRGGIGFTSPTSKLHVVSNDTNSDQTGIYSYTQGNGGARNTAVDAHVFDNTSATTNIAVKSYMDGNGNQNYGFHNYTLGQGATNIGIYTYADSATNNYAAYFEKGAVYIGDSLIIPNGAQNNYVLTSDNSGIASWKPVGNDTNNLVEILAAGSDAQGDSIYGLSYFQADTIYNNLFSGSVGVIDTVFVDKVGFIDTIFTDSLAVTGDATISNNLTVDNSIFVGGALADSVLTDSVLIGAFTGGTPFYLTGNSPATDGDVLTYQDGVGVWGTPSSQDNDWDTTASGLIYTENDSVLIGAAPDSAQARFNINTTDDAAAFIHSVGNTGSDVRSLVVQNSNAGTGTKTGIISNAIGTGGTYNTGVQSLTQGADTNVAFFGGAIESGRLYNAGIQSIAAFGDKTFGIYSDAYSLVGDSAFGVYARAQGAGVNYSGYFADGDVYIKDTLEVDSILKYAHSTVQEGYYLRTTADGIVYADTLSVVTCPSGYVQVNANYCIQADSNTADSWFDAVMDCSAQDAKLPSWAEWYSGVQATGVTARNTSVWEWIDSGTSNNAQRAGGGGSDESSSMDAPGNANAYRCIYYLNK